MEMVLKERVVHETYVARSPDETPPPYDAGLVRKFVQTFTQAMSVTILGETHQLETCDILVQISDPNGSIMAAKTNIHPDTYDVVITFTSSASGRVLLLG